MDNHHYLPNFDRKSSKAYTPIGVRNLLEQAVNDKNGNIQAVFDDKHQNKSLMELYHASFLALAIKKWLQKEFVLYPADSPDIYFLDQKTDEAFPVEVMELYFHNQPFNGNYKNLAKHVFETKGKIQFPKCHLLIVSRINETQFNVSEFCREIKDFQWNFERIWFEIYTAGMKQWTFFEIYPKAEFNDSNYISFNLESDKKILY
ncbi:MAG TPA: hypothetical protein ENN33_11275 [Ignavibacteria bacterium]|nr:hypothetical protein [Ignavibacteria bacterium]